MSSAAQKKILGIVKDMITEHGLEPVTKPQWANTGTIHLERPGAFGALAKVTYSFQDSNFSLAIYRCTGGRDVGVPSQPPRQGYFDHYLQYSDTLGFSTFQRHLRETMEAVAPKPKPKRAPRKKPTPKAENTRVMEHRWKGNVLEVWLPPVDHPEGELVLSLDGTLIPALEATLKLAAGSK